MGVLSRWGELVRRYPGRVLSGCLLFFVLSLAVLTSPGNFLNHTPPENMESTRAVELMNQELPGHAPSFQLVFTSRRWTVDDSRFQAALYNALTRLRSDPRVAAVRTDLIARDRHRMLTVVEMKGTLPAGASDDQSADAVRAYPQLRAEVQSRDLEVLPAGALALHQDLHDAVSADLRHADLVVVPIALVLLLLVFGAGVAAMLPLAVGVLAVTGGVAGTLLLSRAMPVSIFAINIVSMIGLGVAIDYSLFFVSRYREELRAHGEAGALVRTTEAMGRVVLFSGATVIIGLLALLRVPAGGIASMGLAGVIVVAFSLIYELTFLVAALALLGRRVDFGRLPFVDPDRQNSRFWRRVATMVMAHPWGVLVPVTLALLLLGTPVLQMHVATDPAAALPDNAPARRAVAIIRREFPGANFNHLPVVFYYPDGSPLEGDRLKNIDEWAILARRLPHADQVSSVLNLPPAMFAQTVGPHIVALTVVSSAAPDSPAARALVADLRDLPTPPGAEVLVTGDTAFDVDFIQVVRQYGPSVVGAVLAATYVLLFLLLGSVLLPLKAMVMNLLSITASYGALVWLFQEGHWSRWLQFAPGPIEPLSPLIMFCVLFGLSMDYEVLLLSRTREEFRRTYDNSQAVVTALQRTGRLITGAAAIMAVVFFGFGVSRTVAVKSMGIGMGIAVVVDATIVRALLVPAVMQLLGKWNWWAPPGLRQIHRWIGLGRLPRPVG